MQRIKQYQNHIVAAILVIMFIVTIFVTLSDACTMDEVAHIPSGYSYVKYQDMRLNPEHPPLLKDLAGIPLQFLDVTFPTWENFWTTEPNGQWNAGWRFIYYNENGTTNNTAAILFWSRFPIILLGLLLGWFIFRWTKEIAGTVAGLIALLLYAFDPNVLGHNHYVTTDLGIAAFTFFSFYYFIRYLKTPNWKTIGLAGLFLGLAMLAKYSAVLVLPIFGLTLLVYVFARKENLDFSLLYSNRIKKFWLEKLYFYSVSFAIVLIICFLAIWVLYVFNTLRMPPENVHELIDTQLQPGTLKFVGEPLHFMANIPLLKPLAQYLVGLFMVLSRVAGGNTTYFFGEVTNQSFRAYFPMVFLIKETIPILLLILFSVSTAIVITLRNNVHDLKKIGRNLKEYLSGHIAEFSMLAFIALYLYTSITGNLNIGFRHLFPILPFMYLLIAKEIMKFRDHLKKNFRKAFAVVITLLLIWQVTETALAYPYYVSYFNQLIGGSKNGYKYVTDSNVDWGQDLKRLQKFVDEQEINEIRVDYFGGGDVKHYLGDKAVIWHANMGQEPGWYAISATFLQNSLYYKLAKGEPDYQWLREREPFIQVGKSILVYKITKQ